jgi:hypothetical protein
LERDEPAADRRGDAGAAGARLLDQLILPLGVGALGSAIGGSVAAGAAGVLGVSSADTAALRVAPSSTLC